MAVEQDILSTEFRQKIIGEILLDENKRRKAESLRRVEIYKANIDEFLSKALQSEYSKETEREMRKIKSINPAKRAVDEMASIYKTTPKRNFSEVNEAQIEVLGKTYEWGKFNVKLKKANKYYKFLNQCAIQVIPQDGKITAKVYAPHQYDVIPREDDLEKALAYVINTFDRSEYFTLRPGQDDKDQVIADQDDYKKRAEMRFIWWTDNYNFVTDGNGVYLPDAEDPADVSGSINPIGKLPFIDVASEKDHEFWVTDGNTVIDFTLDFAVLLSDTATINRNQGFSQAIFSSPEKPASIEVGRQRVLWLKQNPDPGAKDPKFEFATPNPDLAASLEMLENFVRYWLSTQGIDPKTISGRGEAKSFSSGVERLLSMLDKFEASQDDLDLFKWVEYELFDLVKRWHNAYSGTDLLKPELSAQQLPEQAMVNVQFQKPSMIQTQVEKEDSLIKLKNEGLKDDVEVIMELEEVDEGKAMEILVKRKVRQAMLQRMVQEEMSRQGLVVQPTESASQTEEETDPDDSTNVEGQPV